MKARGKAWKYGDNVDTDVIIPARYLNVSEPAELARHCMEDLDPGFTRAVVEGKIRGDIVVAGSNFGCGSSREHAPIALKASGISCIIAKSFARIFFRNCINIGLPIIECPEAADGIDAGHLVEVDTDAGLIRDLDAGTEWKSRGYPEFLEGIIRAGGLVEYAKSILNKP